MPYMARKSQPKGAYTCVSLKEDRDKSGKNAKTSRGNLEENEEGEDETT